jgi:hypothetical protein
MEEDRGRGPDPKPTIESIAEVLDVPLEFVCKVARASAVAEAGHVERGAVARHCEVQ